LSPAVTPEPLLGPPPPPPDDDVLAVPELPDCVEVSADVLLVIEDDAPVFCAFDAAVVVFVLDATDDVLAVPDCPIVLASVGIGFGEPPLIEDAPCVPLDVEADDDPFDDVVVRFVVELVDMLDAVVAAGAGLLESALELPLAGAGDADVPLDVEPPELPLVVVDAPALVPLDADPLLAAADEPSDDETPLATELELVPALANDVAAVPPLAPVPGLSNPVPPCGPVMTAPPVDPFAAAASGNAATCAGVVTSPRISIEVSRPGPYAIPPGARILLLLIALTTSPRVNFEAAILLGSTSTSIAGVTVPPALTLAMPSTCSKSGTISFVTSAERSAELKSDDVTTTVATVASLGSNVPTDGAERSLGKTERVDCRRRCTSTSSVV
jgi:hypothetical protein